LKIRQALCAGESEVDAIGREGVALTISQEETRLACLAGVAVESEAKIVGH
jgi:hypothetical protein